MQAFAAEETVDVVVVFDDLHCSYVTPMVCYYCADLSDGGAGHGRGVGGLNPSCPRAGIG